MPINLLVPPDDEDPIPGDIRTNFEVISSMIDGLAEVPAGLAYRPVVVNSDGSGLTQGTVGAGLGPSINLDGGLFRGAIMAVADAPITAGEAVLLADSMSLQEVNSATSVTLTIASDDFPAGATVNYVQTGAGKIIFSPTSPLTLVNYSGHTKSGGQYAVVSLTRIQGGRLLLTGITSA